MKAGVTINRPPRDGNMAFVRSPDKHSIELLQKGEPLPPKEPWTSMPNTGQWYDCVIPGHDRRSRDRLLAGQGKPLYMSRRIHCRALFALHPRPSSSGLGHRPFTAVTRVRVP